NPATDGAPMVNSEGNVITFASTRTGNLDIFRMNLDGTGLVNITNNPAYAYAPAPSEDGTKFAWVSSRSGNNEIWVANLDGSNPVNLTKNSGSDNGPNWSP